MFFSVLPKHDSLTHALKLWHLFDESLFFLVKQVPTGKNKSIGICGTQVGDGTLDGGGGIDKDYVFNRKSLITQM